MSNIQILIDDANGVYIPAIFSEKFLHDVRDGEGWQGVDREQLVILENKDNEYYWEAWDEVLNTAFFIDNEGKKWTLWQDGALFAVALDDMTENEHMAFFGEEF